MKATFYLCGSEGKYEGLIFAELSTQCEFLPRTGDEIDIGDGGDNVSVNWSYYDVIEKRAHVYLAANQEFIDDTLKYTKEINISHGWRFTDHAAKREKSINASSP